MIRDYTPETQRAYVIVAGQGDEVHGLSAPSPGWMAKHNQAWVPTEILGASLMFDSLGAAEVAIEAIRNPSGVQFGAAGKTIQVIGYPDARIVPVDVIPEQRIVRWDEEVSPS